MKIQNPMSIYEKLNILSDAAKYDVACTSSGTKRKGDGSGIGNCTQCGICHSFSADGRCISLLKILFTNECIFDCKYCVNIALGHKGYRDSHYKEGRLTRAGDFRFGLRVFPSNLKRAYWRLPQPKHSSLIQRSGYLFVPKLAHKEAGSEKQIWRSFGWSCWSKRGPREYLFAEWT